MRPSDAIAAWDAIYWLETAADFPIGFHLDEIAKQACLPQGRTLVVLAELEAGGRVTCGCYAAQRVWRTVPPAVLAWEGK